MPQAVPFINHLIDSICLYVPYLSHTSDTNPNFGQTGAILWHFFPQANWAINSKSKGL